MEKFLRGFRLKGKTMLPKTSIVKITIQFPYDQLVTHAADSGVAETTARGAGSTPGSCNVVRSPQPVVSRRSVDQHQRPVPQQHSASRPQDLGAGLGVLKADTAAAQAPAAVVGHLCCAHTRYVGAGSTPSGILLPEA